MKDQHDLVNELPDDSNVKSSQMNTDMSIMDNSIHLSNSKIAQVHPDESL